MKLYQLANEIAEILDTEGLAPDAEAQLDQLSLSLEDKVDGCCRLIQEWKSEATRFKAEAERLATIADSLTRRADRLKGYVRLCMDIAGLKKLETELFRLSICKNGQPSVQLLGDVPPGFGKITIELDRAKVLEAWRAGELPDGVVVEQGSHLRLT